MNNQPTPPLYVKPLLFLSGNGKHLKTFEWVGGIFFLILFLLLLGLNYNFWWLYIGLTYLASLWYRSAKKWIIHNV